MIALVLFVVAMFLWLLLCVPWDKTEPYRPALNIIAWVSVALLFIVCHGPISLR